MLSFALNWYFGKSDTFGYHVVNFGIHTFTAFLLFLTTFSLLHTPIAKRNYQTEDAYFIAILSAALWAINPIQIQAVTYIVQRMTSMAALFYVLGIYLYIQGRQATRGKIQILFFTGCFFSFVSAMMSKENAAMLPVSLLLIEIIFFEKTLSVKCIKNHIPVLVGAGFLLAFLGIFIVHKGYFNFLFDSYESRSFSLAERLFSEPRIVLFYISQIFYPLPERLSIVHDIIISKSLLSPWTTLPAILIVLLLTGIGISQIKKRPVVAFSILFFFLNHIIESTVLPLELIFEHRNYLPSFFIFMPVAAGLKYLLNYYQNKKRFMYVIIASFVTMLIIGFGCFTYIRNRDWHTEQTLWLDAMKKAPKDPRPVGNLAIQLAWGDIPNPHQYDVASAMFEEALSFNDSRNPLVVNIINNYGNLCYQRGEYQKAVETYKKGLEIDPGSLKMRYDLISSLIMLGKWEEGSEEADRLISYEKNDIGPDYYKLKGFILLWQKRPDEALDLFQTALKMEPNNQVVFLNTGVALSLMGHHVNAELFFNKAVKTMPRDIRSFFALLENSIREGDSQKTLKHVERLFAQFSLQAIIDGIELFSENYRTAPMSPELIIPVVKKKMMALSANIAN